MVGRGNGAPGVGHIGGGGGRVHQIHVVLEDLIPFRLTSGDLVKFGGTICRISNGRPGWLG
eukprot:6373517-Karenia_brevis.AAC.1